MALRIPSDTEDCKVWAKELVDACMESQDERSQVYTRAAQYYWQGTYDSRAAIFNKIQPFIQRLAGFLMQPTDVRFQVLFPGDEPEDVLLRAQLVSRMLSADYKQQDADVAFAETVVWALICGCYFLKHRPRGDAFEVSAVHPTNFGVLSETTTNLDEQECFCHVSFPTRSRLRTELAGHPQLRRIMDEIAVSETQEREEQADSYFHQLVVGGLQPLGNVGEASSAAGLVNVFPIPTPWRPQRKGHPTVKHCELWVRDRETGDWTTIQLVYPDILIEGCDAHRNLSRVPGHHPFIKVQAVDTPGYFFGRSMVADVQMLQDVLNKRLRDIKVMWDRNVAAPQLLSGFTSVTEEQYYKIISEGGFINDPNPNAKATKLMEPPPSGYLEELEFLWKLFDEASGFTPVMSGQGESGVRAGVHAQTLVRTSSPRLILQATKIERQLAQSGELGLRIMQAMDPFIYQTDAGQEFLLSQLPEPFSVEVDAHSASPAFKEDNAQIAMGLARAGAIDAEDLVHLLHPPGAELILARLRQRQKAQAAAQQQHEMMQLAGVAPPDQQQGGGRRRRR